MKLLKRVVLSAAVAATFIYITVAPVLNINCNADSEPTITQTVEDETGIEVAGPSNGGGESDSIPM